MTTSRLLIIGGSDAGILAALRARETAPEMDVTLVNSNAFPNFSICGLPFFLGGEVKDWKHLAHRTREDIEREGIRLMLKHEALKINPRAGRVEVREPGGGTRWLSFNKLILATGAEPSSPKITGLDTPGVFFLRWMRDGFALHDYLKERRPASALIVGGGYIGMEMAEAFRARGMAVTIVEHSPTVLKTLAPELGQRLQKELDRRQVRVFPGIRVTSIEPHGKRLAAAGTGGFRAEADLVLVATGSRPRTELAETAGIELGTAGAIKVDLRMRTNLPDVFAAGDCVETWHRLLEQPVWLPLGSTSHRQGRVAGENAAGGGRDFAGTLGTQVVRVFDLVAARTGLLQNEAEAAGYDARTYPFSTWDHKVYFPGAGRLHMRITGDKPSRRLLGAQIVGPRSAEVSKRIDILAAALFHGMRIPDLEDLDLSYTPPLSTPFDPIQMAAQHWMKEIS